MPAMTCDIEVDIAQAAPNPAPSPIVMRTRTCFIIAADNGARGRAQRQPHTDLVFPFSHGECHHSADARSRNTQRDHREDAQEHRGRAP